MPTIECDPTVAADRLQKAGIEVHEGNTDHERWRAETDGATAIGYDDVVVVQGRNPMEIESLLREKGGLVHLYFDGASRGNPGPAAIGWVLVDSDGIVAENSRRIGRATNNEAEYEALIEGISTAARFGYDRIEIRGDSELIVKQVTGEYNTNAPSLRERRVRALEALQAFENWTITHVPRAVNERADELANNALDST